MGQWVLNRRRWYYINFMNDNASGAGLRPMENAARLPFCVVPVHDRR